VEVTALAEGYHFFCNRTQSFRLAKGGFDTSMLNQAAHKIGQQGTAMRCGAL
jgi:hypothetical protein